MWKYALAAVLALMVSGAQARTLDVSPDVAVELGGATVQQQDVARDDLSGGAPGSIADLGSLPDGADVVGAALLVPASVGMASDGVLEINQTCADNTGRLQFRAILGLRKQRAALEPHGHRPSLDRRGMCTAKREPRRILHRAHGLLEDSRGGAHAVQGPERGARFSWRHWRFHGHGQSV